MIVLRGLAPNSTIHVATLLFVLHPACSYHAGSSRFAPPSIATRTTGRPFGGGTPLSSSRPLEVGAINGDGPVDPTSLSADDVWEDHYYFDENSQSAESQSSPSEDDEGHCRSPYNSYVSHLTRAMEEEELDAFISEHRRGRSSSGARSRDGRRDSSDGGDGDPLWSQILLEARHALCLEPDAGPLLCQHVLRQPSLMDALASIVSHEIETELMPATALRSLILEQLRSISDDERNVHLDVVASANRSPSNTGDSNAALNALLFHGGLHALVCYRVSHRLWRAGRTGLAYYVQSTVSSRYAADVHPACEMGGGTYLTAGGGVVIGETARIGRGVTILQGVTLGGTGKGVGDRHPKVEDGVVLHSGATVLGNLRVGRGAVVTAKSIVTKEVPDRARVSGIPATVKSFRELRDECLLDDGDDDIYDEECDLDCKMNKLYEEYLTELEMDAATEMLISDS